MKISIKYYEKIASPGLTSWDIEKMVYKYGDVQIVNEAGEQYAVYYL